MERTSIDGLVAHCQGARFTGILRMSAREGIGEVWFLSGIADEVHFGVSTADEAMERMRTATQPMFELVARLPHPAGGFKRSFPSKGSVATATPVTLMRYCERYALTCTLEIESRDVLVEAKYVLGELVSVETTADDDGITAMLEAKEGTYAFTLPRVELPAGTPVLPPATLPPESLPPESLAFRALLEAKPLVGRQVSDEAEVKRKTVEIARQQKAAAPAPAPKPTPAIAAKKEEPKPVAPEITAKKEEPKPIAPRESKPVPKAAPTPTPTPAPAPTPTPPPVEAKTAPPAASRSVPPRPASISPKPATREPEKVEAKPVTAPPPREPAPSESEPPPKVVEVAKEEPKPVAAAPAVEEKRDDERAAAPDEDEPAPKPVKRRRKKRPAKEEPPPPPPAKRSMTWLVVPLLVAAAVGYLMWTHRI